MTSTECFEELLNQRLECIRDTLSSKSAEYASSIDRLHNFKAASGITREHPAQVCVGFMVKHLVSVLDLVTEVAQGNHNRVIKLLDEKLGDCINYMILLEAIIKEDICIPPYSPHEDTPGNTSKDFSERKPIPQNYVCVNCRQRCSISAQEKQDGVDLYRSDCCGSYFELPKAES